MKGPNMYIKYIIFAICAFVSCGLAQDVVVGLTVTGSKFDKSFNEATWNGINRAVKGFSDHVSMDILEFQGDVDAAGDAMRSMASAGADLIFAPGFLQAEAVQTISAEFPNTNFITIDALVDNPNVRSVLFKEHEGSFLVGYISGTFTRTGVVGFVGGMDVPLLRTFDVGYREGVKAACSDCKVISNYVGATLAAFNDPNRAKEIARVQHARGVDIFYAAAGASGSGVIDFVNERMCFPRNGLRRLETLSSLVSKQAVFDIPKSSKYAQLCGSKAHPIFYIGVDSNQNYLGDTDGNPETLNHGLTSMYKLIDKATFDIIVEFINEESFTAGIKTLGLYEGGVDFSLDVYNRTLFPEKLLRELSEVKRKIVDGTITVTDYRQTIGAQ